MVNQALGEELVVVPLRHVYEQKMKLRPKAGTADITIPVLVLRKLAEERDMSIEQFVTSHVGVWKFNAFPGIYLTFEPTTTTTTGQYKVSL